MPDRPYTGVPFRPYSPMPCVRRRTDGALRVAAAPALLRVDVRHAHALAATPRAGDDAALAAEVGNQLAGAPAGHTLSRAMPVGLRRLPVVFTRHADVETSVSFDR
jgi:hypothetical protein